MDQDQKKSPPLFNAGFIICILGTLLFVPFALALETKGSWAEDILQFLLKYRLVVIVVLFGAGVACFLPFLKFPRK